MLVRLVFVSAVLSTQPAGGAKPGVDPSSNATLVGLKLASAGEQVNITGAPVLLKPSFKSMTFEYHMVQDASHPVPGAVIVTPSASDAKAAIEVNGCAAT